MRLGFQIAVLALAALPLTSKGAAEPVNATTLLEKLAQRYKPVGIGFQGDASKQKLLNVRLPGIIAAPLAEAAPFLEACSSVYRAGAIVQLPTRFCSEKASDSRRELKVADRVYVSSILVDPTLAKISFFLTSCGRCSGEEQKNLFRARLVFEYAKGKLAKGGVAAAVEKIEQVLAGEAVAENPAAPASDDAAGVPAQATAAPNTPAPGDGSVAGGGETPVVKKGDAVDAVLKVLGNPLLIFDLSPKLVHVYAQFKVIYVDGKLEDVQ